MKKYATEIKWGIIFAIAGLIWMFIEKSVGLHGENIDKHPVSTWIFIIPAFFIYYLALKEKRDKDYSGEMTWKQGFMAGMGVALVIAIISPLSQFIVHTIITPDYFETAIAKGVEMGRGTEEEISKMMNLKMYMLTAPPMSLVMGGITSAIVAFFVKRD